MTTMTYNADSILRENEGTETAYTFQIPEGDFAKVVIGYGLYYRAVSNLASALKGADEHRRQELVQREMDRIVQDGMLEKPASEREGTKAKRISAWTESVLQWTLVLSDKEASKWRGLAVTLGMLDHEGTVTKSAAEQKELLQGKASKIPVIAQAIDKVNSGESAIEIEEVDLGF